MIELIDKPRTIRHIAWHWIFGVTMILDGLIATISLGLLHSSLTVVWLEATVGDWLHHHKTTKTTEKQFVENANRFLEEIQSKLAQSDPSQVNMISLDGSQGMMPTRKPDPEDWN